MRLSSSTRLQILTTLTGLVVFTTCYGGQSPMKELGPFYYVLTAYLTGVLIHLSSVGVMAGYCSIRKRIFPQAEEQRERREMEMQEVLIVFCVSLLTVCAVLYLNRIGVFENLTPAEELAPR